MQGENSQPQHKTLEDIELLVSIYAYQKELLACLKEGQGRLPDPKFKSQVAWWQLAVQARKYLNAKVPFPEWPPSLRQWTLENRSQLVPREHLKTDQAGDSIEMEGSDETTSKHQGNQ